MLFFSANQKIFSLAESFTNFTQSRFYVQKLLLHMPFFAVRKNFHFHKPKGFLFQKALCFALKSLSFSQPKHRSFEQLFTVLKSRLFTYKKPFICTNLSFLPPKITLFCPPLPIQNTLNLLFAKNTAVLLLFALILCCKA